MTLYKFLAPRIINQNAFPCLLRFFVPSKCFSCSSSSRLDLLRSIGHLQTSLILNQDSQKIWQSYKSISSDPDALNYLNKSWHYLILEKVLLYNHYESRKYKNYDVGEKALLVLQNIQRLKLNKNQTTKEYYLELLTYAYTRDVISCRLTFENIQNNSMLIPIHFYVLALSYSLKFSYDQQIPVIHRHMLENFERVDFKTKCSFDLIMIKACNQKEQSSLVSEYFSEFLSMYMYYPLSQIEFLIAVGKAFLRCNAKSEFTSFIETVLHTKLTIDTYMLNFIVNELANNQQNYEMTYNLITKYTVSAQAPIKVNFNTCRIIHKAFPHTELHKLVINLFKNSKQYIFKR